MCIPATLSWPAHFYHSSNAIYFLLDNFPTDFDEEEPADSVGEPGSDDEFSEGSEEPEPADDEDSEPGSDAESDIPSDNSEPEDEDEGPEDLPPPPKGKGGFVLPVRTASKARPSEDAESMVSGSSLGAGLNLDSLSSGLKIKQPPQLISKPADAPPPPAPPARAAPRGSATGGPSTAAAGTRTDTNRGSLHATLTAATNPATTGSSGAITAQQAADLASVSSIGLTSAASAASMGSAAHSVAPSAALPSNLVLRDPAEVKAEALANVSFCSMLFVPSCSSDKTRLHLFFYYIFVTFSPQLITFTGLFGGARKVRRR